MNLRPVVPLGVYALICFLHNTMLYGSGGTGSLAVFLNLFLHPQHVVTFDPSSHLMVNFSSSGNWYSVGVVCSKSCTFLSCATRLGRYLWGPGFLPAFLGIEELTRSDRLGFHDDTTLQSKFSLCEAAITCAQSLSLKPFTVAGDL